MTIGFENTSYTTDEGTTVEVCALITSGPLERDVTVTLTSSDGSAEGASEAALQEFLLILNPSFSFCSW